MPGLKTKFINCSSKEITIHESNSGVQRSLFKLGKEGHANSSKVVNVDANATYKEYHVLQIPSSYGQVTVTSDDLAENKEIKIMEVNDAPGVFDWIGTPRNLARSEPEEAGSSAGSGAGSGASKSGGNSGGFVGWVSSKWSRKPTRKGGSPP